MQRPPFTPLLLRTPRHKLTSRIVLILAVLIVNFAISDGRTNYLEGFAMMMAYVSIALVCWYVSFHLLFRLHFGQGFGADQFRFYNPIR